MTLIELQNKIATANDEIRTVIANGEKETRKLTADEDTKLQTLRKLITDTDAEIKVIEAEDRKNTNTTKNNITIITKNMKEDRFSFTRAINAIAGQKSFQDGELRIMEIGNKAFMNNGLATQGQLLLPLSTNRDYAEMWGMGEDERRSVLAAASNAAVQTSVMDLLGPLYSVNPLLQAGSQVIYATSSLSFPQQSNITLAYVNGENIAETDETPTNSAALALSPYRIAGFVDISKTLLIQQNPANEAIIKTSIVGAINKAIVKAAFDKAVHNAYTPDGFFMGNVFSAFTSTGSYSAAKVFSMISAVDSSDALQGSLSFIMNPKMVYAYSQLAAFSSSTIPILYQGLLAGQKYFSSTAVPLTLGTSSDEAGMVFGDWSKYIQAFFGSTPESLGALSILVDPYTQAGLNAVRLHIEVYQNMGVLRAVSFAKGSGK